MPTQYIKALGALTLTNDGDPSDDVDINTGGTGRVTINGVVPGGGGGGGGDVFLAGAGGAQGVLQTFQCPLATTDAAGFVATDPAANIQSHSSIQARVGNQPAGCEMTAAGTASFTSTVTVGDLGQVTDSALESSGKIQSSGDIEISAAAGFVGQAKIEANSHNITCRDLTATRDFNIPAGGVVTGFEFIAEGTALAPQKIRCNNDFGEMISAKYTVGTDSQYQNKTSLNVRNSALLPLNERKSDLVFTMDKGSGQGSSEVYFENNETISGAPPNPAEYQRLCGINQTGFAVSRPLSNIALEPSNGASPNDLAYSYQREVYDVFVDASVAPPSRDYTTRICNDLTNDGLASLGSYLLMSMSGNPAVRPAGEAGFLSKYPQLDGTASPVITWNVGNVAGEPGINNFGMGPVMKRKNWRIKFEQQGDVIGTAAPNVGVVILRGFEGYIDVCIGEIPEVGNNEFQYKDVCYSTVINRLQSNAAPAGTRTRDRGQVRMIRRNQFNGVFGAFQFFMDFPSWDLTSLGGTNSATTMTLNFTFTCLP